MCSKLSTQSFDSATAGPSEHYGEIAAEIWQLWQEHIAAKSQS